MVVLGLLFPTFLSCLYFFFRLDIAAPPVQEPCTFQTVCRSTHHRPLHIFKCASIQPVEARHRCCLSLSLSLLSSAITRPINRFGSMRLCCCTRVAKGGRFFLVVAADEKRRQQRWSLSRMSMSSTTRKEGSDNSAGEWSGAERRGGGRRYKLGNHVLDCSCL